VRSEGPISSSEREKNKGGKIESRRGDLEDDYGICRKKTAEDELQGQKMKSMDKISTRKKGKGRKGKYKGKQSEREDEADKTRREEMGDPNGMEEVNGLFLDGLGGADLEWEWEWNWNRWQRRRGEKLWLLHTETGAGRVKEGGRKRFQWFV